MSRAAPLVPPRRRLGMLLVAAAGLAVLVGLGVLLHGHTAPSAVDRSVHDWVTDWLSYGTAVIFADLGAPQVIVPAVAVAAALFTARRWTGALALVVLAPIVAVCLTDLVFKPVFDRRLYGGLAYPSGHTTAVSSVAFAVVVVALGPARAELRRAARGVVVGLALFTVVACTLGLVGADYHYVTDTVGGAALALAVVLLLALAIDAALSRQRSRSARRHRGRRPDDAEALCER